MESSIAYAVLLSYKRNLFNMSRTPVTLDMRGSINKLRNEGVKIYDNTAKNRNSTER